MNDVVKTRAGGNGKTARHETTTARLTRKTPDESDRSGYAATGF